MEILINLGLSVPSSSFFVLMSIVTAGTMILYFKRFTWYSHLAWAMPAITLFFYYLSFPNYIVFWLIPLLPELVRYRPWALRTHERRLEALSMHRSIRFPSLRIRSRLASSALIVLVVVVALAGVSGAYIPRASEPRVKFWIDRMLDPDDLGAPTSLEVTLVNPGSDPVSPRFFVKWSFLPFLWTADSTTVVALGATGHYVLTATDARAAIPQGAPFRVLVFNSLDGNLVSQSVPLQAEPSNGGILTPLFRWWTLDSATGRKVPFGWQLFLDDANPSSGIEELEGASSGGVG